MESSIARLARVNVFTRDAPEFQLIIRAKLLVYAYALPISNSRSLLLRSLRVRAYQNLDAFARLDVATCPVIISYAKTVRGLSGTLLAVARGKVHSFVSCSMKSSQDAAEHPKPFGRYRSRSIVYSNQAFVDVEGS
jgi:hypothetical protein